MVTFHIQCLIDIVVLGSVKGFPVKAPQILFLDSTQI